MGIFYKSLNKWIPPPRVGGCQRQSANLSQNLADFANLSENLGDFANLVSNLYWI